LYRYLAKNLLLLKVKDAYADFVEFRAVSTSCIESAMPNRTAYAITYTVSACLDTHGFAELPKTHKAIVELDHGFWTERKTENSHCCNASQIDIGFG
jgi:hypothetical protein